MHAHESIKKLGAKLAEFAVQHPSLRFTLEEALDAQRLLPYLAPYASGAPFTTTTAVVPTDRCTRSSSTVMSADIDHMHELYQNTQIIHVKFSLNIKVGSCGTYSSCM
jgi:hypothetical protein